VTTVVTLRQVAARAGVAPITASRILNGSSTTAPIAVATRQRVEAAARELGYRVDGAARAMRRQRSGQVGAILVNHGPELLTNPAAFEYLMGLNDGLAEDGFLLSLVRIAEVDAAGPAGIRALDERLFDGFVVISHLPESVLTRLESQAEISVWLDTNIAQATRCVRRDEQHAATAALDLLLARRRRIIWPQRPPEFMRGHYSHGVRDAAVKARCAAVGADLITVPIGWPSQPEHLAGIVAAISGPECGLLLNDPTIGRIGLSLLAANGLVPGRDLGVACCDADMVLGQQWPDLSRIQVARDELGRRAGRMLATLIRDPTSPPPSLLITSPVIPGRTA
jgi:LacI family transcriptional regulator